MFEAAVAEAKRALINWPRRWKRAGMKSERGLAIPVVGKEAQWLEENWSDFEKMAAAGDEDFKGLVDEVKKRPELLQSF
ncbi:hypothetical protein M7I_6524 [Glarea lozoyensis 74030]|uniref:Uncharacterized protein n=1 Tax=Glarea lozoyensis (strain ATCC 74030 / MF5533) TaxID=1104152 RepID=H0EUT5_GLAL7|nr:hypothetical protein M7I_6524 [Glarea lozoyensis 74030]